MADGINSLIATGGGYRPPAFDYAKAKAGNALVRGQELQNTLMQQQVEANPYQQKLTEQQFQIKKAALDLREYVLKNFGNNDVIEVDIPLLNGKVKGRPSQLGPLAEMVAEDPSRLASPGMPLFLMKNGIGFTEKKPEGWKPATKEEKLGYEKDLAAIKAQYKKGMKVYDSEGNLILDTTGGEQGLEKKTKGTIEEKLLGGHEQLSRMLAIKNEFKPEFQEVGTRLSAAWTGTKAFLGMKIPKEDKTLLTEFGKYRRKAIENINLYIKEITGAQMSEKEASRLRLAMPDPGEHWWQGDDPITFKAKMDDIVNIFRATIARFDYYKNKGLSDPEIISIIKSDKAISLDDIVKRMQ